MKAEVSKVDDRSIDIREKVMYGHVGTEIGSSISTVCKITGVSIIKGGGSAAGRD